LGPDVGLNLLCVIQHGTPKIQVGSVSVLKPGVSKVAQVFQITLYWLGCVVTYVHASFHWQ
jgi:hypothetical protein